MRRLITFLSFCLLSTSVFAQTGNGFGQGFKGGPQPQLTATQEQCLRGQLGDISPDSGSRPSKESLESAFKTCGINPPAFGPGEHGRPQLTDEQRSCLYGKIGSPTSGQRPSRDQMDAAVKECGIQAPHGLNGEGSPDAKVDFIENRYKNASSDTEKAKLRDELKAIFASTDSDAIKSRIRAFFKNNPDKSATYSPQVEVAGGAR